MIKIIVADDQRLVRIGLTRVLQNSNRIEILAEATSGEEAIELCRSLHPNIVLLDVAMPGIGGIEATRRIKRMELGIKVIIVTNLVRDPFPVQALKAGANGYLSKRRTEEELETAISKVFVGNRYLSTDVAQLLAFKNMDASAACPFENLSNREMQIALMVVSCHKVPYISKNLHLSPKTVNSYRYRIFDKLAITSDVELTLLAVQHGLVENPVVQVA
ncbi:MAG: response regulator [Pseudomonadales bacterium]|nr:response regulator [Pseudomonadales bacterium]